MARDPSKLNFSGMEIDKEEDEKCFYAFSRHKSSGEEIAGDEGRKFTFELSEPRNGAIWQWCNIVVSEDVGNSRSRNLQPKFLALSKNSQITPLIIFGEPCHKGLQIWMDTRAAWSW